MCACTNIFTKPSIPQTHLWCVEASAVKNCLAILPADIIPRSENACLQGHFREAVNGTSCGSLPHERRSRRYLPHGKYHVTIIPRSENVCLHKHFREAVNCAAAHCAEAAKPLDFAFQQNPCAYYTTYSRVFKRCTHILTSSAPHPPNIRPCQPHQTALISSGSSPNYVLLFQRIVPICDYTL